MLMTFIPAAEDDLQLDGLAIIVNGTLVADITEVEDLAATNKYLETEFVFCQAKSGDNFSGSEISNFFFGVNDLFSEDPALPRQTTLSKRRKLSLGPFTREVRFSSEAIPSCTCTT